MIQEIETALAERVRELMAPHGLAVGPMPDNADGYRLTHSRGAVLVCYSGGRYDAPETTDRHVQKRTLAYDLTVMVRNLRSHEGAYAVIDALAGGLIGWKSPFSLDGARLAREGFTSLNAGVWEWSVTVEIDGYLFPATPKAEKEWAPIKSITGVTDTETTTVEAGGTYGHI